MAMPTTKQTFRKTNREEFPVFGRRKEWKRKRENTKTKPRKCKIKTQLKNPDDL